jgi:hypothetical protein
LIFTRGDIFGVANILPITTGYTVTDIEIYYGLPGYENVQFDIVKNFFYFRGVRSSKSIESGRGGDKVE